MQIQNSNNQNFTAIYKLPKSTIKAQEEIDKFIAPVYNHFKQNPVYYFCGDSPCDAYVAKIIEEDISKKNLSYEWILQNARNFNIELPDPQKIDVWVITGEKDINLIDQFNEQADKICKPSFLEKAKRFLFGDKRNYEIPEHLDIYSGMLEKLSLLKGKFREIIADKKVIEVDSTQNLAYLLMKE